MKVFCVKLYNTGGGGGGGDHLKVYFKYIPGAKYENTLIIILYVLLYTLIYLYIYLN